jgi:hypothetical protein
MGCSLMVLSGVRTHGQVFRSHISGRHIRQGRAAPWRMSSCSEIRKGIERRPCRGRGPNQSGHSKLLLWPGAWAHRKGSRRGWRGSADVVAGEAPEDCPRLHGVQVMLGRVVLASREERRLPPAIRGTRTGAQR